MKKIVIIIFIVCFQYVYAFEPMGVLWPVAKIPLPFYIHSSVNSTQNGVIQSGYNVWTMVETTRFEFSYQGTSSAAIGEEDGINTSGFGTALQFGSSLAVTFTWYDPSTDEITDADIEFNSSIDWASGFDLMTVAIHEAGHVLGLGHETTEEAIMQPIYFGVNQQLFEDDIEGVSSLYPGSKSFSSDNIFQNAPNPFVPNSNDDYTVIGYSIKSEGNVKLEIYNLAGELVKVLIDEYKDKGEYTGTQGARWHGDNGTPDMRGKNAASGVYIAALKTSRSKAHLKKIMLIR
ncbi:MAG: matrixin family metalloprotease [bacterium]